VDVPGDGLLGRLLGRTSSRSVPDAVRAVVLDPGERRLAWAVTDAGQPVLATDVGLRLPDGGRWAWPDVERVSWRRPTLLVVRVSESEGGGPRVQLQLEREEGLADVVRSQVTASIAWSDHVRLAPAGGVRVVGRRRPGQDLLDWQLVFDAGTDPTDPFLRAQADEVVERARRTIG
jgi:hypothetical protein